MKKIILTFLTIISFCSVRAQQDLLDDYWILHSMVIDGNTINVPPQWGAPIQSGIDFYESSPGVHNFSASAGDINVAFDLASTTINTDTFVVQQPSVTLGACSNCILENQYLGTIFLGNSSPPSPRTFDYEIITEANGDKTLIIDTPEGNRAVHGNYILARKTFSEKDIRMYPNPVKNKLYFDFKGFAVEKITVFSIVGTSVFEAKVSSQQNSIDLSFLAPGMYVTKTTFKDGDSYISKFIKK